MSGKTKNRAVSSKRCFSPTMGVSRLDVNVVLLMLINTTNGTASYSILDVNKTNLWPPMTLRADS